MSTQKDIKYFKKIYVIESLEIETKYIIRQIIFSVIFHTSLFTYVYNAIKTISYCI